MRANRPYPFLSQVEHVHVRPDSGVVGEIPAGMVGILVNHNRIGGPKSVADIRIIERGNTEVRATEPETLAVAPLQVEYVTGSKTERKAAVFERPIEMETAVIRRIVFVPDPLAVRVDMRSIGMARHVPKLMLGSLALPFGAGAFLRRSRAPGA